MGLGTSAKRKFPIVIVTAFLFWVQGASANDVIDGFDSELEEEALMFEEIPSVFGASKYEQKVTEAPSRVSIVTGDEIRKFGYRTLGELLGSLSGFSISNDRNYGYVGVRGFGVPGDYDTRLLQLVDGHRINDNVYGSLFSDHSFSVDLHLIERVEVIRGPSSSLYGSGAFFGVVNIITKRGRDIGGWEVSGSAGSLDSQQGHLTFGRRLASGLEVLVSGTIAESQGNERLYYPEFDDPATNYGVADGVDEEAYERIFTRVAYGDFELEGAYGKREKSVPTASYSTVFNAQQTRTWDSRSYLDLKYQTLSATGAEISARLYYDRYWYKGDYLYDYGDPGDAYLVVNKDGLVGQWWGTEAQWGQQLANHHVIAGVDYRSSLSEEQTNFDIDAVYLDSDTDSSVWAVYVQDEIRLRDQLVVNVGLRYDNYDNFGSTTNPRGAVIWTPLASSAFKFLYGEAFRAPNAYELHYNDGGETQKPSPGLEPESIKTMELVWEQQFSHGLRSVASVYKNKLSDLIALTTDPADDLLVFVNKGDAQAQGLELELEKRWANSRQIALSYTYQDAEDSTTGERLVNYATDMIKLNVRMPLLSEKLGVALEAQYESGRLTLADQETDSRTLVNMSLFGAGWIQGLNVSATVYNLFDVEYAQPGSEEHIQDALEQDGRTFRFQLSYSF